MAVVLQGFANNIFAEVISNFEQPDPNIRLFFVLIPEPELSKY